MLESNQPITGRNQALIYQRLGIILILIGASISAFYFIENEVLGERVRLVWFAAGAAGIFIIWLMKSLLNIEWLAPPTLYAIIFWVFHFGLLFPASISLNIIDTLSPWTRNWVFQPDTVSALLSSLLYLASFSLAIFLSGLGSRNGSRTIVKIPKAQELVTVGWVIIGAGFFMGLIAIAVFGWRSLASPYEDFFTIHNSFSWPVIIVASGIMFQLAGGRDRRATLKSILFLFVPLALPVFLAGARTGPLFSSAAMMSLLALRGLHVRLRFLAPAILLLLVAISTVTELRQEGVKASFERGNQFVTQDPLAGLTELGGSLRPVSAAIDYVNNRGRFFYGSTYLFPFVRQLERFTGRQGNELTDERFIASRINLLYGSIGFSVVAEAYVNGGIVGVVLFALSWGLLLGWLTGRATNPYRFAVLVVFMIPMFINVRNSFIYVPAWIFLGLMTICAARLLAKRQTS